MSGLMVNVSRPAWALGSGELHYFVVSLTVFQLKSFINKLLEEIRLWPADYSTMKVVYRHESAAL